MKAIVIYKSNTGFTKRYAEWIAEELQCGAISARNAETVCLEEYDAVIFGGWIFAGEIQGFKEYREKLRDFKGKKAVFMVGAMPAAAPQVEEIRTTCFTEDERRDMGVFFMRGGLDYKHMRFGHKVMMKVMCAMMKKQKGTDSTEYKTVSQSFDATDREAVRPLVDSIRKQPIASS